MFDIEIKKGDWVEVTDEGIIAYKNNDISSFNFPVDLIESRNKKYKVYDIKPADYTTYEIFLFDPDVSWNYIYLRLTKNLALLDINGNPVKMIRKINNNFEMIEESKTYLQKKFGNINEH